MPSWKTLPCKKSKMNKFSSSLVENLTLQEVKNEQIWSLHFIKNSICKKSIQNEQVYSLPFKKNISMKPRMPLSSVFLFCHKCLLFQNFILKFLFSDFKVSSLNFVTSAVEWSWGWWWTTSSTWLQFHKQLFLMTFEKKKNWQLN